MSVFFIVIVIKQHVFRYNGTNIQTMDIKEITKKWGKPQIVSRLRCCLVSLGIVDDIRVLSKTQLKNTKTY